MQISRSGLLGPILVLLGVMMLFWGDFSLGAGEIFAYFWPVLFVMPVGLFFHWMYFSVLERRGVGLLVPGGIVLTAGIVCQIATLFDSWDVMWPGFILAAAVGLFELYWFGGRNKWLLIPINILSALSLLFFAVFSVASLFSSLSSSRPFVTLALIVAGGLLMLSGRRSV